MYRIPAEFTEDEKIFGGRYTLKQAVFTVAGVFLGFLCLTIPVFLPVRIFLLLLFIAVGLAFAFLRIRKTELLVFCLRYLKFSRKTKDIILIQGEEDDAAD